MVREQSLALLSELLIRRRELEEKWSDLDSAKRRLADRLAEIEQELKTLSEGKLRHPIQERAITAQRAAWAFGEMTDIAPCKATADVETWWGR